MAEIVLFEDHFRYDPRNARALYRCAGDIAWRPGACQLSGTALLAYAAQLKRCRWSVQLNVDRGAVALAPAWKDHGRTLAPTIYPGGVAVSPDGIHTRWIHRCDMRRIRHLTVDWSDMSDHIRVGVDGCYSRFRTSTPPSGGFSVRGMSPDTRVSLFHMRLVWQDARRVVLLHGDRSITDRDGLVLDRLPPPKWPLGITCHSISCVDLASERALVLMGDNNLRSEDPTSWKGWAVLCYRTGEIEVLSTGPDWNGCRPMQGGGGMSGEAMLQSWNCPGSLSIVDWSGLMPSVRAWKHGVGRMGGVMRGYHDPCLSLDGAVARWLEIDQRWLGYNIIASRRRPHDMIRCDMTPEGCQGLSQTGPAGLPTQMAVRDADRAMIEYWAYRSHGQHACLASINLWTGAIDWVGARSDLPAAPHWEAYANVIPDLQTPGEGFACRFRFASGQPPVPLGWRRIRRGRDQLIPMSELRGGEHMPPIQVLL